MNNLKKYQDRVEMISSMMNVFDTYNQSYFSVNWLKKMFNLEKKDIRKLKINRIFND